MENNNCDKRATEIRKGRRGASCDMFSMLLGKIISNQSCCFSTAEVCLIPLCGQRVWTEVVLIYKHFHKHSASKLLCSTNRFTSVRYFKT